MNPGPGTATRARFLSLPSAIRISQIELEIVATQYRCYLVVQIFTRFMGFELSPFSFCECGQIGAESKARMTVVESALNIVV